MEKIFFCARNIQDYLSKIKNVDTLNLPADACFGFENLTIPFVQEFLRDLGSVYCCPDAGIDAPICGETDIDGLRLDFNFGLRLDVPAGNFRVRIGDADSEQIFFDEKVSDVRLISVEKYFIRWRIEIFLADEKIFDHTLDLDGQPVLIVFDKDSGLGDTIAFLPYVAATEKFFNCRVSIFIPEYLREFAANLLPHVSQVDEINFDNYATYYPLMTFGDFQTVPSQIGNEPLERMAGVILGIASVPAKPTFTPTAPPVTKDPYVCIAVQAATVRKSWLWPNGWDIVVDYLKTLGYRVFCIDKENFRTNGEIKIHMPTGAEDFTGNFPIMDRANMLYHAEFFIGLSSGLSWVADAVNCPVVMICGFSKDWSEFYTPYRVANRLVCNGCVNDLRVSYFQQLCPYYAHTPRESECQKKISPRQVLNAVERLIVDRNLTLPILRSRR